MIITCAIFYIYVLHFYVTFFLQRLIDETRQLLVRLVGDKNRYRMLLEGLILQVNAPNTCVYCLLTVSCRTVVDRNIRSSEASELHLLFAMPQRSRVT